MKIMNTTQMTENTSQKITISKEAENSISHRPNLVISIIFVSLAFAFVPLLPILIAFIIGHCFSKNNKKG